ncbi:BrnT family toxin [Alkanindiges hydrocarboniclasticus]|nr:BrnT family toxin [Alkanindiges hydrocarboniclasticus]
MEGIHLLYLEINKIFSLSCQPICNSALIFEWHDAKFEMVYKGRQITFEEACSTFFDDYAVTIEDIGHYDEQRLLTTGMSKDFRLLTVVWVESNDTFRLITAFEPTKDQQRRYEYAKRNS